MDMDSFLYIIAVVFCVLSGLFTALRIIMWHVYNFTEYGKKEQLKDVLAGKGLASFPVVVPGSIFFWLLQYCGIHSRIR